VRVGRDVLIAAYCYLIGGDHDFSDPSLPVLAQQRRSAGVTIGDGAWLGAGAKILDGVSIGERAVVGAAAVVRDDVPAGAIAVGIPAKVIGVRSGRAPSTGSGQGTA
jgi:acetyltransferase-like isoleucine patch superfamily enzyme